MTAVSVSTVDVRTIAPRNRHRLNFGQVDALAPGGAVLLANAHDPRPQYHPFEDRHPGPFTWTCVQSVPDPWRVQIDKTAARTTEALAGSCRSGCACRG